MAKTLKKSKVLPAPRPAIPAPPPYHDRSAVARVLGKALDAMEDLADEYGAAEVPERLKSRAGAILVAPTLDSAQATALRVQQAMQVHVLAQWAKNKIPGKLSEVACQRRIKKALSLATVLDAKGLHAQAEAQRERAERIRGEWEQHLLELPNV